MMSEEEFLGELSEKTKSATIKEFPPDPCTSPTTYRDG